MALQTGQFAIFPTRELWNAVIEMAVAKGVPVYEKTRDLRRWDRFPGLKMGRYGLAGFRPEGKPEEDDYEELAPEEFICKLAKSAVKCGHISMETNGLGFLIKYQGTALTSLTKEQAKQLADYILAE